MGREPWARKPSPRPALRETPLPSERGEGERERAVNPRLAPWAKLWRSFGAEFFNELLRRDISCLRYFSTDSRLL